MEARRVLSSSALTAALEDPDGEKASVLASLRPRLFPAKGLQKTTLLLAFHGCAYEDASAICSGGFASATPREGGYFGKGHYLTTHAAHACKWAIDAAAASGSAEDSGELLVLVCWAATGAVYPISRAVDYEEGGDFSAFYQPPSQAPSALKQRFNAHYACVRAEDLQCQDGIRSGSVADYDELVVEESQRLVPAYRMFFSPA